MPLLLQIGLKCLDSSLFSNKKVLSLFPSLKAVFLLNIFQDSLKTFHELVKLHFKGFLKPPFNTEGRRTAGMTEEVYLPLLNSFYYFFWLHNLNDILFDQPLYLQWYVPLVKPSSLQKTSWLWIYFYSKRGNLFCIL